MTDFSASSASDSLRHTFLWHIEMSKPILVTGATGNQGGAVVDALIKQNEGDFTIVALTRNTSSPSASRLAAKSSLRVLQGDMDQPDAIFSDAQKMLGVPIWGVFMVQVSGVSAFHLRLLTSFAVCDCWRRHSRSGDSPGTQVY